MHHSVLQKVSELHRSTGLLAVSIKTHVDSRFGAMYLDIYRFNGSGDSSSMLRMLSTGQTIDIIRNAARKEILFDALGPRSRKQVTIYQQCHSTDPPSKHRLAFLRRTIVYCVPTVLLPVEPGVLVQHLAPCAGNLTCDPCSHRSSVLCSHT
jgi:hypothetical protein